VHEVPGNGAWLKVPLGKLDTERMVPLDDETVTLIDRITATRSEAERSAPSKWTTRAVPLHPPRPAPGSAGVAPGTRSRRAGRGHRSRHAHQLRHTFATVMVNAGVSLQALMALLGHVSAEMSLRYGRLFDATVRAEYERALDLAKARIGPLPAQRVPVTGEETGVMLRSSRPGSPAATAFAHRRKDRALTRTSANTVLRFMSTPAPSQCSPPNGWMPRHSLPRRRTRVERRGDRHRRLISRLDTLIAEQVTG